MQHETEMSVRFRPMTQDIPTPFCTQTSNNSDNNKLIVSFSFQCFPSSPDFRFALAYSCLALRLEIRKELTGTTAEVSEKLKTSMWQTVGSLENFRKLSSRCLPLSRFGHFATNAFGTRTGSSSGGIGTNSPRNVHGGIHPPYSRVLAPAKIVKRWSLASSFRK